MLGISLFSLQVFWGKRTQPKMPQRKGADNQERRGPPPLLLEQLKSRKLLPSLDKGGEGRDGEGGERGGA